jgi:hypothetical protein
MRTSHTVLAGILCCVALNAQTPAPQRPAAATQSKGVATPAKQQVNSNLAQLMRGILYPASNVIFAAQDKNPADVPPDKDPATAVNPLASAYGGWTAVENAALALSEGANLLSLPGRKCSNGRPVPINAADWPKFVEGLRAAGLEVYKAAQSKNQDKIVDAADTMTQACQNCHDKYRETKELADRCK